MSYNGAPMDWAALRPELKQLRRRLNMAVWLESALPWCIWCAGCVATGQLAAKLIYPQAGLWPMWGLLLAPIAGGIAWWRAARQQKFYNERELVEVADHLYRDDGALSAAYENPALRLNVSQAGSTLAARRPQLRLKWFGRRMAPVAAYVALAVLMPERRAEAVAQGQSLVSSMAQPLQDELAMNEEVIAPEEKQEIVAALDALQQQDQGVSREQWEAVEELEARVDQAIERGQANARGFGERAEELAGLMDAQGNIAGETAQQQAESLAREMEKMLQDAKRQPGAKAGKELSGALKQLKSGQANPELKKRLQELAEELKRQGECKGCKSGTCNRPGHQDGKGAGRGGVTRGRGDAELSFDPESKIVGKYKDQELQNQFFAPEDLADMGITPLKPDTTPGEYSAQPIRQQAGGPGAQASRTRITPSQRDVLSNYFKQAQ